MEAPYAQPTATPDAAPASKSKAGESKKPARWKKFKDEAAASREVRDKMVENEWRQNVEYRRGKPFKEGSTEDQPSVPTDWSNTKAKEAGLFSQVPTVILSADHDRFKLAIPVAQKELNNILTKQAKVGVAMEEVLADKINAAGLAGVIVGRIATFKSSEVDSMDISIYSPEQQAALRDSGMVKKIPVKTLVDSKFFVTRLSPSQLLWPKGFKGSDFDDADWVGYDGTCSWVSALREFGFDAEKRPNGLKPEHKKDVCGSAEKATTLSSDKEAAEEENDELVSYTRMFYWAARCDENELYLEKIRTLVYVNGIDDPVIDEDLNAQMWDEETASMVGVTKFPLRMGTLTYISDMPVPPSDSEIARPMTDYANKSLQQMLLQRDRSFPVRWGNVNRIAPEILESLMRGDNYQRIVPVNGDGSAAIGEVARANYPPENWEFDRINKQNQSEAWQVGPNQVGGFNPSGRTKGEADIVQAGFATRQAKERAKIGTFFCGIAEVMLGYMQMFYEGPTRATVVGGEGVQQSDAVWDRKKVSAHKFVCTIREDSTVKLDTQQRFAQCERFLNTTGKSGFVNVKEVVSEMAVLSAMDVAKVIVDPNPPKPEPPNVSLRAGGEDLRDPVAGPYLVATMQKGPNAVTKEDIEAAIQLLIVSSSVPAPVVPPQPGVPGAAPPAGAPPAAAPPPPPPVPQPDPKDMAPLDRITKRTDEVGG